MIEMGIEASIFRDILNGRKTVEGRLRTAKFVTIRVGDTISFRKDTWQDDRLVDSEQGAASAIVTATTFYDTFEQMLSETDYKLASPRADDLDDAVHAHSKFFTPEQEAEHGVVAIHFKLK